jgi:hypothetical protein
MDNLTIDNHEQLERKALRTMSETLTALLNIVKSDGYAAPTRVDAARALIEACHHIPYAFRPDEPVRDQIMARLGLEDDEIPMGPTGPVIPDSACCGCCAGDC